MVTIAGGILLAILALGLIAITGSWLIECQRGFILTALVLALALFFWLASTENRLIALAALGAIAVYALCVIVWVDFRCPAPRGPNAFTRTRLRAWTTPA